MWSIVAVALCAGSAFAAQPKREQPVSSLPQWHDFSLRQSQSLEELYACERNAELCTSADMERWAKMVSTMQPENKLRQLITVNRWFNRMPYKYDEYAYNTLDYWADTAELLNMRGDCEDYALSKYYTLRHLGFTPDQLKIMVVYDQQEFLNHAVLMVYVDDTRYMLDINADSTDPTDMGTRYKSIYGFNEQTAWYYR